MADGLLTKQLSFDLLKQLITSPITTGLNVAVIGPPGVGKSTFCQNLIVDAYKAGLKCIYIVTGNPIQTIKDQLTQLGLSFSGRQDPIIFVDMYSWLLGERTTERYQVDNTSDLAALSVVISGAAEAAGEHAFLMFDSLSALPAYNTEELCTRFVKSHLARMKKHGNVGVYNVEQGIHKESFYNEIRASFDTVIEMKLLEAGDDITRMIRVYSHRGIHSSRWFKFLITPERTIKIT